MNLQRTFSGSDRTPQCRGNGRDHRGGKPNAPRIGGAYASAAGTGRWL